MSDVKQPVLSVVVPVYNEAVGLEVFHASLVKALRQLKLSCEILYIDDGSADESRSLLQDFAKRSKAVRLLCLSRNFGKEIATSAGLQHSRGNATLMIDADGQHPVDRISDFVAAWRGGSKVVVGVRERNHREGFIKRYGSKLFYACFNHITKQKLVPGTTDFRLIDETVREEFNRLGERNRITRGLIDWLGYEQVYLPFIARERVHDTSGYSFRKLTKLAIDSVISLSTSPLYLAAYVGSAIMVFAFLVGLVMGVNFIAHDPLHFRATASAYGLVLVLFLVGVLLVSQGIIGLYLSHIHAETQNRPLYIIDRTNSRDIE